MRHDNDMIHQDIYDIFEEARIEATGWFSSEIVGMRTGRVTPDLVERIPVEHYGSRTPLKGLASINNLDARTLVVAPWDGGAAGAIEKALSEANLGAQPNLDGQIIRLVFPSLTEEMREQTIKMLHKKIEEARVRLRQARDDALKLLREEREEGSVTEDDFYATKKRLDELIDEANAEIEKIADKKEEDIKAV